MLIYKVFLIYLILCHNTDGQKDAIPDKPTQNSTQATPRDPPATPKPCRSVWPGTYENDPNRTCLGNWLITGCGDCSKCACKITSLEVELPGYDGWYNNLGRPDSGAVDTPLLRRWPAAYTDGTYKPIDSSRPNPLQLSQELLSGDIGTQSRTGKNALLVFFGQQVVEEILDAQRPACPPEYFNIKIPENHTYYKNEPNHTELPLLRTRYDQNSGFSPNNPRQQLNEITPYIDGGLMYGVTKQWADQLRTYNDGRMDQDGLLASSSDGLFPEYNTQRLPMANPPPPFYHAKFVKNDITDEVSRFFKLGNPRGNENTFLLSFGILWFRWHNYLARIIKSHHLDWSSDKVFNEARKWVIATHQHIVFDEWLPAWVTTPLEPYKGYDPSINPQIDQFFQSAAFRFGHTLVTPGVYLRDYGRKECNYQFENWKNYAVRTCNSFWRPQEALTTKDAEGNFIDIDRVLMGMSLQLCEEEDHKIVEDLRGNVFGPLEFPRRDLMAINIQRGRDHGLPDFNSARKAYGLHRVSKENVSEHFKDVSEQIKKKLLNLYEGNMDNIDTWVGGILETSDGPGELFETIILDQFRRIRDGDRFWFNNTKNGLFTADEINRIKDLKLYDIIMAVTKMDQDDIPRNVFNVPLENVDHISSKCHDKLIASTCTRKNLRNNFTCYHLPQLNAENLNEPCVQGSRYDYFQRSEVSYIATIAAIGAFITGTISAIFILVKLKNKQSLHEHMVIGSQIRQSIKRDGVNTDDPIFTLREWTGPKSTPRSVAVMLNSTAKQMRVLTSRGVILRAIDLSPESYKLTIYLITDEPCILIKTSQDYDLMLKFDSNYLQKNFHTALERFIANINVERTIITNFNFKAASKICITKEDRQKQLEMFFRVVFAQAFGITHTMDEILKVDANMAKTVIETELTLNEFADALSMKPNAEFVMRMFNLVDKDKNGFVSFREFADLLIIFANGDEIHKAKLLFNMYDINQLDYLTIDEFSNMIKSFLETVEGYIEPDLLKKIIKNMINSAGLQNKNELTFDDFKQIIGSDIHKLNHANLGFKGVDGQSKLYLDNARNTMESIYDNPDDIRTRLQGTATASKEMSTSSPPVEDILIVKVCSTKAKWYTTYLKSCEQYYKEIFFLSLYTLVLWAIFAERAYYYSVEREHSGLRRIAGYGVTITRGAASAMMFTYSSLLVTMCRNTITFLRDTVAASYFPLDSFVEIHKYIAYWALFFTVMHIVGHFFNFYHISTQTADDLTCLFRNYFHATHELPKFHYWCWQTMTGFTGIVLTLIMVLIYLFAQTFVRKQLYNWFWYTHNLYMLFFVLMILHGSGRLIQEPFFYYFFLGPVIMFTLDNLISISRKKVEIPVVKVEILPSSVTMLEFKRPENFEYKSGQWVRVACLGLNSTEFHPFTLTSSPNEKNLTLHIRSVGPWTRNIRSIYKNAINSAQSLSKIHLDGPYGEGHQDWYRFDVSVLIGGGIGVTPFASILKDIVFRANIKHKSKCKKVYFIWVSRTQKQFEWLVDILRDLEKADINQIVSSHIFITQFYQKYDLRTILLYICELHYQKLSEKSLFTNLKAVSHFGRPDFKKFFKSLQTLHYGVGNVGVFSCGPPPMTSSIEAACVDINKITADGPTFTHHFKNF